MVKKKNKRKNIGKILIGVGFILFFIASLSTFLGSNISLKIFDSKINFILFIGLEIFLFIKGAIMLGEK